MATRLPGLSPGAVRGRAGGVIVGALIGFGWFYYATGLLAGGVRILALIVGGAIAAGLIVAAGAMIRTARSMRGMADGSGPPRRLWLWFLLIFVGEVILLNLAINLLAAPRLHIFRIPAISAVVGLHFLPMAILFRTRSHWWIGGAMIATAAVVAVVIGGDPARAEGWARAEGLANAGILWGALAATVVVALRRSASA